ncbi:glycosyltransferase [Desulfobacula sp.]|uniref:glycosyltransferase n=1 Tax=Desulfobacula sp. TaxID=2593537 RepID=UPI0026017DF4|nr:glycosyltransferase [Desulfobacula sp.]
MKNSNEKKWLILAHCFNMDGRAASHTITDKIPFLIKNGIAPVVISAPTGTKDKKFVHYQVISPAPSGIIFEMRKIIEKKFQKGVLSQVLKAAVTVLCFPFYIIEKIFINLDSHWSWFITASAKGIFVIKKYKPQLIYSTAGPSSTHLAGFILKKLFNIPWVAEIHDPLISESGSAKKVYQRHAFHRWLEKVILENACAVIYFTEKACENAKKRTKADNNIHVLRPGADPPNVSNVKYKKRGKIHFGHFGSLASDRNFYVFMEALSGIFREKPHLKKKVVLDIYGTKLDSISKNAVKKFSLEDVVCEHGRLESDPLTGKSGRQQVFEKMHGCDVLILIHGQTDTCNEYIPSKLYEYLLTKRPIAGIASKDSELASILNSVGHPVVDSDNVKGIEAALKKFIFQWENDQLFENKINSPFTVENTVDKLMEITKPCFLKQVS